MAQVVADGELMLSHIGQHAPHRVPEGMPANARDSDLGERRFDHPVQHRAEVQRPDPNHINSLMNFRVADIQASYDSGKSRGAEFTTEPIPKYGETRCYIRDPGGYIIEVGQSTDLTYG